MIRHTRVAAEMAGICYGRSDVPLAPTFAEEAQAIRAELPCGPRLVWTSPALRCVALAEQITGIAPLCVDARLAELDFGVWEGRRWEEFRSTESEAWALDPWGLRPPSGESGLALWARVAEVRAEVLRLPTEGHLVIVTHAGVIRAWLAQAASETPGPGVWAREVKYGNLWLAV